METSVTVKNSPIQDYVNQDVYTQPTYAFFLAPPLFFVVFFFLSGDRFKSVPVLAYSTVITVLFRRTSGRMGKERAGDW